MTLCPALCPAPAHYTVEDATAQVGPLRELCPPGEIRDVLRARRLSGARLQLDLIGTQVQPGRQDRGVPNAPCPVVQRSTYTSATFTSSSVVGGRTPPDTVQIAKLVQAANKFLSRGPDGTAVR